MKLDEFLPMEQLCKRNIVMILSAACATIVLPACVVQALDLASETWSTVTQYTHSDKGLAYSMALTFDGDLFVLGGSAIQQS